MKIEIERKLITIIVGERGRPEVRGREKITAYCFPFRGYELASIYVPDPSTGYCGLVLVQTGCGLLDPVPAVNPVELIFKFMEVLVPHHDRIELMCKEALGVTITAENTHHFDAVAAASERRGHVVKN